jgi:hypothetical protein
VNRRRRRSSELSRMKRIANKRTLDLEEFVDIYCDVLGIDS